MATVAIAPMARAMAGSVIDASHIPGSSANGVYPSAGKMPSSTAKTSASTMPMRKFGTANATIETPCSRLSSQPPRTAATTPRTMLTTAVSTVATENQREGDRQGVGDERAHRLVGVPGVAQVALQGAGQPVPVALQDRAGPVRAPASWPRSRPDAACGPRIRRAGSEPVRLVRKKTSVAATHTSAIPAPRRRRMKRSTIGLRLSGIGTGRSVAADRLSAATDPRSAAGRAEVGQGRHAHALHRLDRDALARDVADLDRRPTGRTRPAPRGTR